MPSKIYLVAISSFAAVFAVFSAALAESNDLPLQITEPKMVVHGQEFDISQDLSFSPDESPWAKFYLVNNSDTPVSASARVIIQATDEQEEIANYTEKKKVTVNPHQKKRVVLEFAQIEILGHYSALVQYVENAENNKPVSDSVKFQWRVEKLAEAVTEETPAEKLSFDSNNSNKMTYGLIIPIALAIIAITAIIYLLMKKKSFLKSLLFLILMSSGFLFAGVNDSYALRNCPDADLSCVSYHSTGFDCNFSDAAADNYCRTTYGNDYYGCCYNNDSAYCAKYKPNGTSCGTKDCDYLNSYFCSGSASPAGTDYCKYKDYSDCVKRCQNGNCQSCSCNTAAVSTRKACGKCKYCVSSAIPSESCLPTSPRIS